jgi:hypothetical protein
MTEEKKSFEGAEKRHKFWEAMGCQIARTGISVREYNETYYARHGFVNEAVMAQYMQMLRMILCPACTEVNKSTGYILASALVITIEDDVMTTWPAMGHFTCHHCGFEEWHPMQHDPRATNYGPGQMIGAGGGGGAAGLHSQQIMDQYRNSMAQQGIGNAGLGAQQSARMQQMQDNYNQMLAQKQQAQQRLKFNQYERDLNSILGSWV